MARGHRQTGGETSSARYRLRSPFSSRPPIIGVALLQASLWNRCLRLLESEIPEQQFNTWVRPLQAVEENGVLRLLAPNRFVVEWLTANLRSRIEELVDAVAEDESPQLVFEVGSRPIVAAVGNGYPISNTAIANIDFNSAKTRRMKAEKAMVIGGRL